MIGERLPFVIIILECEAMVGLEALTYYACKSSPLQFIVLDTSCS